MNPYRTPRIVSDDPPHKCDSSKRELWERTNEYCFRCRICGKVTDFYDDVPDPSEDWLDDWEER